SFGGTLRPAKTGRTAGSLRVGRGRMFLVHLDPSKLKAFDKYEFDRETVEQATEPQTVTEAAIDLLKQAGEKKAKIEEVRGWADKAFKTSEAYGLRWQRSVSVRLAQALG